MTDAQMMQDPNLWPMWPLLPLKRPLEMKPCCGFLAEIAPKFRVYHGYIWDIKSGTPLTEVVKGLPYKDYSNVQDIISDRWMVD